LKWSSRGRPVNLIDRNEDQLKQACVDIENWKKIEGVKIGHRGGRIDIFKPDQLQKALHNAWLAVEVRQYHMLIILLVLIFIGTIVCTRVFRTKAEGNPRAGSDF